MNKRQLEVQKASLADEKKIIQQLKTVYSRASKDCEEKIRELAGRTDMQNLQSIIYQQQYQQALKKQIDGILDTLQSNSFSSIAEYLTLSYENGFFGTLYDLQGQGIPLIFPIDQRQVVEALKTDTQLSTNLYSRLGEDVDYLKKSIRAELSRGISNGSSWVDMATHIANGMNSPFNKAMNNAMRIARTEGHRIQNKAQWDTLNHARDKGADIVKQWDSTLDRRTRKTHQRLDGQIRELDEPFEVNGKKAMMPGDFGVPSEDIHCRCCMLQRARWALDDEELQTLKEQAAYYGLDKSKDFEDYKSKYLAVAQAGNQNQQKPSNVGGCKDFNDLEQYFSSVYGVAFNQSVKSLDFQTVQKAMDGVENVIKEFPDFGSILKSITTSTSGVMSCTGEEITFNPNFFSSSTALSNACQAQSKKGFWIKNSSPESIGVHESGHGVEWLLIQSNPAYTYDFERIIAWNDCDEAKSIVSKACKNIKKTAYGKGKKNAELKKSISGYAATTASETMAEAFADVFANGKNANPLSTEIKRLTIEKLKQYKGGAIP